MDSRMSAPSTAAVLEPSEKVRGAFHSPDPVGAHRAIRARRGGWGNWERRVARGVAGDTAVFHCDLSSKISRGLNYCAIGGPIPVFGEIHLVASKAQGGSFLCVAGGFFRGDSCGAANRPIGSVQRGTLDSGLRFKACSGSLEMSHGRHEFLESRICPHFTCASKVRFAAIAVGRGRVGKTRAGSGGSNQT